jgi:hypothetical protein
MLHEMHSDLYYVYNLPFEAVQEGRLHSHHQYSANEIYTTFCGQKRREGMFDVHSSDLWAPDDSHGICEIVFASESWKRRDIVVGTYLLSETLIIQWYPDSVETVLPGLLEVVPPA